MIVTLAGHVDHGKTSLVRALTGVDTDSLAEEKRRGLTIDLGFAYFESGEQTLGFVDVPGHHRFIHNMVAGVAADQHALLVIAADDGPMPQSREHLQILDLIGVRSGTIALTKCDRVNDSQVQAAKAGIKALVESSFLRDAEIIETSTTTGAGIEALKSALLAADRQRTAVESTGVFRLPIDRAFAVTGAGVVVTGTVHDGSVSVDQSLTLFPSGRTVRVKSVHAQNRAVDRARAGDRCALNLAGVAIDEIERGDWVCAEPDSGRREFAIELDVLADFPRAVRHWLPVHVYHATSHSTGKIALLQEGRIQAGSKALVELETDEPLAVRPGDRLILRDQGLDRTLGGATVISRQRPSGRRRDPRRLQRLAADAVDDAQQAFANHLQMGTVDLAAFKDNWGMTDPELVGLIDRHSAVVIQDRAVAAATWQGWCAAVSAEIATLHRTDASLQGAKQSELKAAVPADWLSAVLADLTARGELSVNAGRFSPVGHLVVLSPAESQLLDRVLPQLDQPQPPSLGDMSKTLRIPIATLSKGLMPLVSKKLLVRISDNRYYTPQQITTLAGTARALGDKGAFTARDYRDAAGIGRNVAIELLEYFDRRGFTKRQGDTRTIVGGQERVLG